jgi:hypothetical protein
LFELKDKINFKISTRESGLGVTVHYESEIEAAAGVKNETATEYEVIYTSIVEYRKASSDSTDTAYDWGNDTIVQELSLANWGSFSEVTDIADGDVSHFSVVSSLEDTPGHVNFNFTVTRASQDENSSANKMKIDFSLVDFPWVSNDTYVALLTTVESKQKVHVKYHDKESMDPTGPAGPKKPEDVAITFDQAQDAVGVIPFGEYTWEVTAEATVGEETSTPTTISVVATSPQTDLVDTPNPAQQWIAFSFVGDGAMSASNIYWDPETGVGYSGSASSASDSGAGRGRQSSALLSVGTCLVSSMLFLLAAF